MPNSIVVTGPESTGKSTTTQFLAQNFSLPAVSEMARSYLENLDRDYVEDDLHKMAKLQLETHKEIEQSSPSWVVCDTDLLTFVIWWEVKYGACPAVWVDAWRKHLPKHYLLMNIDLPWEADPLREHPHLREELFERYLEKLENSKVSYTLISGSLDERFQQAQLAVGQIIK